MSFPTDYIEDTDFGKIWLEDGLLHSEYPLDFELNIKKAKKAVRERLTISNGITYPLLADARNLKTVDDDARDYLASEEASEYINALAIITGNRIQKLFANFYLLFSKPPMPTRLFTNEKKALNWLKSYKK